MSSITVFSIYGSHHSVWIPSEDTFQEKNEIEALLSS